MNSKLLAVLIISCAGLAGAADQALSPISRPFPGALAADGCLIIPSLTNSARFRIFTNAAAGSPHLLNGFEIEAFGQILLPMPEAGRQPRWPDDSPSNAGLHNILINGAGPVSAPSNSMTVVERASGPEWSYVALDASAGYGDRLKLFRRAILFIEPDLFVLHDQLVGKAPVTFKMMLHPPAATQLDSVWHDLRLQLPGAGLRIHTPAERHALRSWERVESPVDALLPGTVTLQLGPTNKVTELNVLTVFAVYRSAASNDYAFKLLESKTAVGARIHRAGLPTLVAFRIDPAAESASLTGFGFRGPVGVDVFKPRRRPQP